eukprot:3920543-Prymnesium_polylepis.1
MIYDDGGLYEGQWVHGLQHGRGSYLWTWGDKYDGGWRRGKKEGVCVHTYADGGHFEGTMKNDVREGRGHFDYHFGDTFDGYYSRDLKDYGLWHYANGEVKVCAARARRARVLCACLLLCACLRVRLRVLCACLCAGCTRENRLAPGALCPLAGRSPPPCRRAAVLLR